MDPSRVRETILEQHKELRGQLAELRGLAAVAGAGAEADAGALREMGVRVLEALGTHLDYEDRHLVPAVRDADAWGEQRAMLITREHAEQRELFAYILERLLETGQPSLLLARQIETLVDALLVDMDEEEKTMLSANLLRDDVVSIDMEAG